MSDETVVRLKIISTKRTPESVSEALGLACDRSWHVGEKRKNTIIVEKNNGWVLESGLSKTTPLDEHIRQLLAKLAPHREKILLLSQDSLVELSCVIYANSPPALNFDKKTMHELGEIGASLDIDLYVLLESETQRAEKVV